MQKFFLSVLVVFLYSPVFSVNAESQSPSPIAVNKAPSSVPSQDNNAAFDLNSKDMEKLLQTGEAALRKVMAQRLRKERQQHLRSTEKAYQEAVSLYRQQKLDQARDKFSNVEDAMADYKSTERMLRIIENQQVRDLKLEVRQSKQVELYEQQRLDQIAQKADSFNQQVAQLVKTGEYPASQAKYDEFRNTMAYDLANLKESVNGKEGTGNLGEKKGEVFDDTDLRRLEENFFRQGVDLCETKNYEAARIIFNELASHGDVRAKDYLIKTELLMEEEALKMGRGDLNYMGQIP